MFGHRASVLNFIVSSQGASFLHELGDVAEPAAILGRLLVRHGHVDVLGEVRTCSVVWCYAKPAFIERQRLASLGVKAVHELELCMESVT